MMTLRRKLVYQIATLIVSLLLAGITSIWQTVKMQSDFSAALNAHQQRQNLYEVGTPIVAAQFYLNIDRPEPLNAHLELERALDLFNHYFPSNPASPDNALQESARQSLQNAVSAD